MKKMFSNIINLFCVVTIISIASYYAHTRHNDILLNLPPSNASELKNWQEPIQKILPKAYGQKFGNGYLTYMAEYEITATILGKKRYNDGKYATVAPLDLALGWKYMSEPIIFNKFAIRNENRQYYFVGIHPMSRNNIIYNSANVHIIPANTKVWKQLKSLELHDMVTLKGYLVNYHERSRYNIWELKTSLIRTDTGDGGCEVMYVQSVEHYTP